MSRQWQGGNYDDSNDHNVRQVSWGGCGAASPGRSADKHIGNVINERQMIDDLVDVKRAVSAGRKVKFAYYRDGALWYETVYKERFPVPINDIGSATFLSEDKAILFMRYMNKYNSQNAVAVRDARDDPNTVYIGQPTSTKQD